MIVVQLAITDSQAADVSINVVSYRCTELGVLGRIPIQTNRLLYTFMVMS